MTALVLLVDDDPAVRDAVGRALEIECFDVVLAAEGDKGLELVATCHPEAILLDLAMPGTDGLAVCRRLRDRGDRTPIMVLTARDGLSERVAGLDAGADDYLVKPFELDELLARLRALLRRAYPDSGERLSLGDLTLDPFAHLGTRSGRAISFTRTEAALLELFLRNPGQVLPRDLIEERVWSYAFGPSSNSLEVYISYLRRKLESGGEPRLVHTVRGVGYRLGRAVS